jgi:site-specific recombinase XerD
MSKSLELIESPKTGRKLPDTLAIAEIDSLIAAIDLSSNGGTHRDVGNAMGEFAFRNW